MSDAARAGRRTPAVRRRHRGGRPLLLAVEEPHDERSDDRQRPGEPEGSGPVAERARGAPARRRRRGRSCDCAGRGRAARRRCPPRAPGSRRRRRASRPAPPKKIATTRATRMMIGSTSRWRASPPATPATCRSVTLRRRRPRSLISSRVTRGPDGGRAASGLVAALGGGAGVVHASNSPAGGVRTIGDSPESCGAPRRGLGQGRLGVSPHGRAGRAPETMEAR